MPCDGMACHVMLCQNSPVRTRLLLFERQTDSQKATPTRSKRDGNMRQRCMCFVVAGDFPRQPLRMTTPPTRGTTAQNKAWAPDTGSTELREHHRSAQVQEKSFFEPGTQRCERMLASTVPQPADNPKSDIARPHRHDLTPTLAHATATCVRRGCAGEQCARGD